jgi:hypothetical protein
MEIIKRLPKGGLFYMPNLRNESSLQQRKKLNHKILVNDCIGSMNIFKEMEFSWWMYCGKDCREKPVRLVASYFFVTDGPGCREAKSALFQCV